MRYRRGMYAFAGKNLCSRLRDLGCPDTLIKDVRDVAAAVMCSEGPGRSGERLNRPGIQAIYSKAAKSPGQHPAGMIRENKIPEGLKSLKRSLIQDFCLLNGEAPMCCE